MRADLQVSFSRGIPIQLGGEPLEPFKCFLRTTAPTLLFYVRSQFTPGQTHSAANKVRNDM